MDSVRLLAKTEKFGYNLLRKEAERNENKNVWLSPSGVSIPFGGLLNSARTTTFTSIAAMLGVDYDDIKAINQSYQSLIHTQWDNSLGVQLKIATSIWANADFEFKSEFVRACAQYFYTQANTRNFGDPQTLIDMNQWVSDGTDTMITKLIEEIGPDKVLYIMCVVCFKGLWKNRFNKNKTRNKEIRLGNGDTREHPIMFLPAGGFKGFDRDVGRFGWLPFGDTNDRIGYFGILPHHGQTVMDVLANLQPGFLAKAFGKLQDADDGIYFPRHKIEYSSNLNDSLKEMGIKDEFSAATADFGGLIQNDKIRPFIGDVLLKTVGQFDEKGGVAAAAVSVDLGYESLPQPLSFTEPFVGLLVDRETGVLHFAGVINEPEVITQETDWSDEEGANAQADEGDLTEE